jgi:hypothetical protein
LTKRRVCGHKSLTGEVAPQTSPNSRPPKSPPGYRRGGFIDSGAAVSEQDVDPYVDLNDADTAASAMAKRRLPKPREHPMNPIGFTAKLPGDKRR